MPTTEQIKQAKAYLRQRMTAELVATTNAAKFMRQAVQMIVRIALKYNIPPQRFRFSYSPKLKAEVNEVIRWLKRQIESSTMQVATSTKQEKEKEELKAYISGDRFGNTYAERIDKQTRRLKYEVEALIAASLLAGKDESQIIREYERYAKHPYDNPDVQSIIEQNVRMDAIRLSDISTQRSGMGIPRSASSAIGNIVKDTVAIGFMYGLLMSHMDAKGFYSYRGSSYPCSLCDSMVGYHPIDEYMGHWHPNCYCYFIFV